jgi:hypothetical protein
VGGRCGRRGGDPRDTRDHTLCVFAGSGNPAPLVYGGEIPAGPNWRSTSRGFLYRDTAGTSDGFIAGVLRQGFAGRAARAVVKAKGPLANPPPLPLATPVTAQLRGSNGSCFGITFVAPSVNTGERFRARAE